VGTPPLPQDKGLHLMIPVQKASERSAHKLVRQNATVTDEAVATAGVVAAGAEM
jgi:hypothetical protein